MKLSNLSPEYLDDVAARLSTTVRRRLEQHWRDHTLVTYEGTIPDQLAMHFIRGAWPRHSYEIVCSVRPCMDKRLQDEVREFASEHELPFVDFAHDCRINRGTHRFERIACDNVADAITARLQGRNGLLVTSAFLNEWSRPLFEQLNTASPAFHFDAAPELAEPVAGGAKDWQTLFLFEGFFPLDIVVCYRKFVSPTIHQHHVPLCYMICYHEVQQLTILAAARNST
jgi:hypothetical protein